MSISICLLLANIATAQDGITTAFAFGGGATGVDEMRYASDGSLYFAARLGGKNIFAGNNYDAGGYGQYPLQQWLFGKISTTGQQTVLKVFDRNVDNNNLYNSLGNNHVIDKDGNLISVLTGTFPGNNYGDGYVETGYGAKIAKTSNTGQIQWVKSINTGININYGESGTTLPNVHGLQVMDDGTIYLIISANYKITDTNSPHFDKYPVRIIKYNDSGNEIWHHEYFGDGISTFIVSAPKQFADNNGNLVVSILSRNNAIFTSQGTTLTATNDYLGNYWCLMGLDNNGNRKWFHSAGVGVSLRAVDPINGTTYVAYTHSGPNNTPPPIAPYNTLPNINPIVHINNTYMWSGMLKLDITTGNISNATVNLPAPSYLGFLTTSEKLHVRNDGSLLFYSYKNSSQVAGNYVIGDGYNALVFCDATYGNIKVTQGNLPKVELIAENSTNFAFADSFNAAITLGGNVIAPFLVDTDFGTRFPSFNIAKTDAYIAQGVIAQIGAPKVTKWTGAVSTAWNDAGNWSNGVPDAITTAEFDTTVPTQPTLSSATTVGNFTIGNGTVAALPASNITIKNKLTINGTLKFPVAGFAFFNAYSAPIVEGNGTLEFNGSGTAFSTLTNLSQLTVKTNVALSFSGSVKALELVGASAKVTGDVNVTSANVNAITGASTTAFVDGKLTRATNSAGTYVFPVGKGNTYAPATINLNSTDIASIAVAFSATTVSGGPNNLPVADGNVVKALPGGSWTINPNVPLGSGSYDVSLSAPKGSSTATNFVLLKRPDGSTSATAWVLPSTAQSFAINPTTITANATNVTSFSQYIIGEKVTTLPVTLAKFSAKATANTALLSWETLNEKNTAYFLVERSTDAKIFETVGEIKAKGNSDNLISYLFRDMKPVAGTNYYRLKIVDMDSGVAYSDILSLNFGLQKSEQITVYPNPASKKLYLNGIKKEAGSLYFYSLNGQKAAVAILNNGAADIPANLPNGNYLLIIRLANGNTSEHKIVIRQ